MAWTKAFIKATHLPTGLPYYLYGWHRGGRRAWAFRRPPFYLPPFYLQENPPFNLQGASRGARESARRCQAIKACKTAEWRIEVVEIVMMKDATSPKSETTIELLHPSTVLDRLAAI